MKSRSHRLPSSSVDQKDDWVEEPWKVDCVCGVNFDDGEEMVDCDECGVWVHTRCSRYVKTEKSFVCHKCKNNNNHPLRNNHNNESSEETEVAQLLVELPTKTLRRMDSNPLPPAPSSSYKSSAFSASSRPFKLWTDIPIEDRVHVQGAPGGGGDPALFSGISAVFGPQLWKCAGYIPKKFNFRYREFPCWDEEEEDVLEKEDSDKKINRQTDISADNGAGVLFSLAKLDVPQQEGPAATPVVVSVGVEGQAEDGKGSDGFVSSKETGKLEGLNYDVSIEQNELVKDRSLLKPPFLHFEKRRREDLLNTKDRSGKKKARILEKDGDSNKRIRLHSPDRGPMAVEVDPPCGKGENLRYPLPTSHIDAQKSNSKKNGRHQVPLKLDGYSKTTIGLSSLLERNTGAVPAKDEVNSDVHEGELLASGGTCVQQSEHVHKNGASAGPETEDDRSAPESNINTLTSCPGIHAKSETELANGSKNVNKLSFLNDAMLSSSGASFQSQDKAAYWSSESVSVGDTNITGLGAVSSKVEDDVRRSEVDVHEQRVDGESPHHSCEPKHDSGGLDGFPGSKKFPCGFGSNAELESSQSPVMVSGPLVATNEGKATASVASSIPGTSVVLMPKSSASENCNIGVTVQNNNVDGKLKWIRESSLTGALTEVVEDEVRHEKARQLIKEHSKSGLTSVSKSSQLKKISHAAIVSKRASSDLKDSGLNSSSSPTLVPPIASHPASEVANAQQIESPLNSQKMVGPPQFESASNIQKKGTGSLLSHKGEKINQPPSQSSSKVNNISSHATASLNAPSTLSDEELALLLHQELNSSPRVPRVPRMRHAGSLPQLASPTASSVLTKRTSSTGGKDHVLAFRRKTKDLGKDGSHGFAEVDDEAKKMDRISTSIDHRKQDSAFISDSVSKREADSGSANGLYSIKKSNAPSRRAGSSSLLSPAEGNETNFSAARLSPRIPSDDEKGVGGRHSHRTLPGLLAEIMSEGKRMTYEELCNSVLPHWPYLRKHNGERYAYSSHSQAVLDCLRNRNEWARLVDRGPKTSGGRKRRKLDAGVESEDNEDGREQLAKDDSRKKTVEEFPKGKRKARKRKRLALHGRGIKDVRRRQKTEEVSDEDEGSFSDSSEETMFSEEEIHGSAGNDVSEGMENI